MALGNFPINLTNCQQHTGEPILPFVQQLFELIQNLTTKVSRVHQFYDCVLMDSEGSDGTIGATDDFSTDSRTETVFLLFSFYRDQFLCDSNFSVWNCLLHRCETP